MHKTILIAEDYDDTRSFMRFLLEDIGYQVEEASNGQEAVEKVKHHFPDLILMDMAMPVMDGLTATQIIRKFDGGARLPIIAITAFGKSYYRQAMEAGCDDLINKPLDPATLQPILNQYLGH
jgi:two-component system, sensor histidine kinase and response regulator